MIYEFKATQDLHGYTKPWAPGAGDNKLPFDSVFEEGWSNSLSGVKATYSKGYMRVIGTNTAESYIKIVSRDNEWPSASAIPISSGTYTVAQYLTCVGTVDGNVRNLAGTNTFANDITIKGFYIAISQGASIDANIPLMFVEGSTAPTAFLPYSNVCPFEGFNIWDPDNQEYVQVYAGYVNANTRELYLRPWYTEYDGEELVGPWMSSMDEYTEEGTPTTGAFVIDLGGDLITLEITPFMLQTLLDSMGIRQHFLDGASLLNSLMDQAQGRVRSEDELLPNVLHVIPIGDSLPIGLHFRPISKDVLPGLPGKFIR